jgi:plasmid maintenance system antidote protein VapI
VGRKRQLEVNDFSEGPSALLLEKAFGVSMDLLLKMQLQFDIARVRKVAKAMKVRKYEPAA